MHCTNDENRDGGCSVFDKCKFENTGNVDECLFYQSDNECEECGADFNTDEDCVCNLYECNSCWGLFPDDELDRNNECEICAHEGEDECG